VNPLARSRSKEGSQQPGIGPEQPGIGPEAVGSRGRRPDPGYGGLSGLRQPVWGRAPQLARPICCAQRGGRLVPARGDTKIWPSSGRRRRAKPGGGGGERSLGAVWASGFFFQGVDSDEEDGRRMDDGDGDNGGGPRKISTEVANRARETLTWALIPC
jgi:hypothetical protein